MTIGSLATAPFAAAHVRPDRSQQTKAVEPSESGAAPEKSKEENAAGLDNAELQQVRELQQTDRKVRSHEQAHLAAAGGLAGGVSFTFVTGPDGQRYAVGGEVSIDTSPVDGDPEATIQKARQIQAAANAPAEPSSQDRSVAAKASQLEQAARLELIQEQRAKQASEFQDADEVEDGASRRVLDAVA